MSGKRVLVGPGVRLTFGGTPNPEAMRVELLNGKPNRLTRLFSVRGRALLWVRYDWQEK